jgi:hypothetical protein
VSQIAVERSRKRKRVSRSRRVANIGASRIMPLSFWSSAIAAASPALAKARSERVSIATSRP